MFREKIKLSCQDFGIDIKIEEFEIALVNRLASGINLYLVPVNISKIENNNRVVRLGILENSLEAKFLENFKSPEDLNNLVGETLSLAFVDNIPLALIIDNNICLIESMLDKDLKLKEFYIDEYFISLTKEYLRLFYGLSEEEFISILKNELPKVKTLK